MRYLDRHPTLNSRDLSELRALLSDSNGIQKVEAFGKKCEFEVDACGVHLDDLHMADFQYDGVLAKFHTYECPNTLQLIITFSGEWQIEYGRQSFIINRNAGLIRDWRSEHVSSLYRANSIGLSFSVGKIADHARYLVGEHADLIVPTFDKTFDMTTPSGTHIRNTVTYVANAINMYPPERLNNIITKSFSDLLLTQILTLIPNSYSTIMDGRTSAMPVPRYVKRARDYIHAHAASAITLKALAEHAGCGYRTLQVAFNNAYGMSPMSYVKHVRLSLAREDLLHAVDGVTVRDTALKWGFTHLGWFSKKYAEQFGALPSETLRLRK